MASHIYLNLIKSSKSWYCVIILLFAIISQLIFFNNRPEDTAKIFSNEARRAIRRAKTDVCKRELTEFVIKTDGKRRYYPRTIRRTCPHDSKSQSRIQKIGCLLSTQGLAILTDDSIINSTTCLELCFSYGHSFGGYQQSSKRCYCGEASASADNLRADCYQDELDWFSVRNGVYDSKSIKNPQIFERDVEDDDENADIQHPNIKIAFLLALNGRSIIQIRRILKNIYSNNHLYYIHVDAREDYLFGDLQSLEKSYSNIVLARTRFNTIWGGPSLLRMIIDSIKNLSRLDWDYLINLSETDFPIKSLVQLEKFLTNHKGSIFLKTHNIKGYDFIKKQGLDWNFYQCEDRVWRTSKRQLPTGIIYSGGSDWFALPRDFSLYITRDNQSNFVKPLLQLFNYTLLPAETFFHIVALNSEFCDRFVDNNLRITNWQRKQGCKCQHKDVVDWCGCSPSIYRWADWKRLEQTYQSESLFFSRKFDPTISSKVISAVENHLIQNNSMINEYNEPTDYDTRYWLDESDSMRHKPSGIRFGNLGLQKLLIDLQNRNNLTKLKYFKHMHINSTHMYFNQDKFVGLTFSYCDISNNCLEFLIERDPDAYTKSFNGNCLKMSDKRLQVIEVNHGFDTSERMFRNNFPLDEKSDIVVYHEWLVQNLNKSISTTTMMKRANKTEKIQFHWLGPSSSSLSQLIQNIKLKITDKLTRLSLAHRMNIRGHLEPGVWTLRVMMDDKICLNYEFLVFSNRPMSDDYELTPTTQEQFNKFYKVSDYCIINGSHSCENGSLSTGCQPDDVENCDKKVWSKSARGMFKKTHCLM